MNAVGDVVVLTTPIVIVVLIATSVVGVMMKSNKRVQNVTPKVFNTKNFYAKIANERVW